MMIDSKRHARELLDYVLFKSSEKEKEEIIKNSIQDVRRFEFRIDEEVFFQEIWKREDGKKFLEAHGIRSLEELVIKQYEYRMKYEWGINKRISSVVDLNTDDYDELIYLD